MWVFPFLKKLPVVEKIFVCKENTQPMFGGTFPRRKAPAAKLMQQLDWCEKKIH